MWTKGKKHPTLLVGMQIDAASMENNVETPLKTKNRATIWGIHIWGICPIPGHISRKSENSNLKRYTHLIAALY